MAELRPAPFAQLVTRLVREAEAGDAIFHLPRRSWCVGTDGVDTSVGFHGGTAATPLGPAAGPQTQMAQNIVLAWLGGCRIHELKTVQVDDELDIPRPCIDVRTVGFNVEWSQELKLEQSLDEYVKGAMLVEILRATGALELAAGFERTLYDMSVGYDLAGIRSPRVRAFVDGMLDCSHVVERLRAEIPDEFRRYRDLDFPTRLSDTLTLSTFHGCPPDEIEAICDHLLRDVGLHTIVKLNPMLLGPDGAREILHGTLGYDELRIPDTAFERDTSWDQMTGFVERLGATAAARELGFGVKFTNTLIVENPGDFLPGETPERYLSGPPLHVLAMQLVAAFRRRFGDRYPISFSAGIDRKNFPDAVACGLVPVTVCTDLLRPGGYGRAQGYLAELRGRMAALGATTIDEFVLRTCGDGDDLAAARVANSERYAAQLLEDPRYRAERNRKQPRKLGSELELFDCVDCFKCVPVCPNDANFTFELEAAELPLVTLRRSDDGWTRSEQGTLTLAGGRQFANFADFCNDCGNCDVFCPEDGGPYRVKPRFFGTVHDWKAFAHLDGFVLDGRSFRGRFEGREYALDDATYRGPGFELALAGSEPVGDADEVELVYLELLRRIRAAVLAGDGLEYPALATGRS